jgi:hypothetical protein
MTDEETRYKLRVLSTDVIKQLYSRKYEQKKYTNVMKKLVSTPEFMTGLQLIQGQVSFPATTTTTTTQPTPTQQPTVEPSEVNRYPIQYNQNTLERIAPENLRDWGKYIPVGKEMARLEARWKRCRYPFLLEGDISSTLPLA